jgi:ribonuclease HI
METFDQFATHDHVFVNTDGGAHNKGGGTGINACIGIHFDVANMDFSFKIGNYTSNVAEYEAIIGAMKIALHNDFKKLVIRSDSELCVFHIIGRYECLSDNLRPLYEQVKELEKEFESFKIVKVKRTQNELADSLVRRAADYLIIDRPSTWSMDSVGLYLSAHYSTKNILPALKIGEPFTLGGTYYRIADLYEKGERKIVLELEYQG